MPASSSTAPSTSSTRASSAASATRRSTCFEEEINKRLKTGLLKVYVAIVPLARDQLFTALQEGKVDFVAAALTITPERRKLAEFSMPTRTNVSEIVVTAPDVAPLATADDLSGREVFVRRSSSYYESLTRLNESLVSRGKPPVVIKEAPEALEDDDILEMVNAGLVELTVVDDFIVEFWRKVFTGRQAAARRRGPDRRRDRGRRAQEQSADAAGREHVDQEIRAAHGLRQHDGAPVPGERQLREERGRRERAGQAARRW